MIRDLIKTIHVDRANFNRIATTGNINGTLLSEIERVMKEYAEAEVNNLAVGGVMAKLESDYTKHFLDWRERFFTNEIYIQQWKTKTKKGTRYTTEELHSFYKKAMLQSPFNLP